LEYPNHGTSTFITNGDHQLFILVWIVPVVLLVISGLLSIQSAGLAADRQAKNAILILGAQSEGRSLR
jgi:cytochrome c-type biogenesis protein CcmH/NrfF